jgi:hypothetical protein
MLLKLSEQQEQELFVCWLCVEQNYLDGDKIQCGGMLSSEECFDAILSALK